MPCQILIKRLDDQYDPANPDLPVWRVGDPVVCRPDTWTWGADEDPAAGYFYVITVSDRTYEQLLPVVESMETNPDQTLKRIRLYEVRLSALTPAQQTTLTTTGRLTLSYTQARAVVFNKTTGTSL